MATYKRGQVWWYKFVWKGELIRESTKQGNRNTARDMESAHRTSLAKGEVGLRDKKPSPLLKDFLEGDFIDKPFKEGGKAASLRYYKQGSAMLTQSEALQGLRLAEITDEHARQFELEHSKLSASGINRGLRTLRRALSLAHSWRKMEYPCKISLASGENQRDRVLTDTETEKYLSACPEPWKTCATLMLDEGFRPSEVFALQWLHVLFNNDGSGLIRVAEGKSKAARRTLPMTPRVCGILSARWESAGKPVAGFVFPSSGKSGHFDQNVSKDQHAKALDDSKVVAFCPYSLRHTCLTKLGQAPGVNVFILAAIAGHSSISVTQRYIHPQPDAIQNVFMAALPQVGTNLGTVKNRGSRRALKAGKPRLLKSA
jgi:integrase